VAKHIHLGDGVLDGRGLDAEALDAHHLVGFGRFGKIGGFGRFDLEGVGAKPFFNLGAVAVDLAGRTILSITLSRQAFISVPVSSARRIVPVRRIVISAALRLPCSWDKRT